MIPKLKEAFQKVESLSESDQEALANSIMETMNAEERSWDQLFARSDVDLALQKLARDAVAEHRRGETKPLELD